MMNHKENISTSPLADSLTARKKAGADPAVFISDRLGPMGSRVEVFVKNYSQLWMDAPSDPQLQERIYTSSEKKGIEKELSASIDRISSVLKDPSSSGSAKDEVELEKLAAELRPVFQRILGRSGLGLETVYDSRFVESTQRFIRAARDFDPELRIASVYQALRNVWIMNTLQFYLDIDVELTDAVFAYSMVYPYLDNYLDDPSASRTDKLSLLAKLKNWLEGHPREPQNSLEEKLHGLIALVERHFPRDHFPAVFPSMLTIYNGQIRSLFQQGGEDSPGRSDILSISLDKGGTSVLADGYLVSGRLDSRQEDFCFGFGTFLQLADDLQDVAEDLRYGHQTLFSSAVDQGHLDSRVNKFLHFMSDVLDQTLNTDRPQEEKLIEVIRRSCSLMAMEAVGNHKSFFSRAFVRRAQKGFPVRFSYLEKLRRTLDERFLTGQERIRDIDPLSVAFMTLSSRVFALD